MENRPKPTFIKVGATTVVDRSGRSRTREEYVRDIQGLVFSGERDPSYHCDQIGLGKTRSESS
jgi:hypothetical protein